MHARGSGCAIVTRDFGEFSGVVVNELIGRGAGSVKELLGWLENSTKEKLAEVLAELGKNGLVTKNGEDRFVVDLRAINRRWRYPYFSVLIAEHYGVESQHVVEKLMTHGSLTSSQLYEGAKKEKSRQILLETLVQNRILFLRGSTNDETSLKAGEKRKRKAGGSGGNLVTLNFVKIEQVPVPEKGDDDTIWSLSYDMLHLLACYQLCVDLVRTNVNPLAGKIMESILKKTLMREDSINAASLRAVGDSTIFDDLISNGSMMDRQTFEDHINLICRGDRKFVKRSGEMLYAEVGNILDVIRRQTAVDVIKKQFGPEARRMFALLLYKKKLEAKQAAELSMLNQKRAREVLLKLYESGYANVQEVPRTSDFKQSRCIYIWGVKLEEVYDRIIESLERAIFNLDNRLAAVDKKGLRESGNDSSTKKVDLLEATIVRLQTSLMIFQDLH